MIIAKAIEILTSFTGEPNKELEPDLVDAVKLGNEALKTVLAMRHYPFPDGIIELLGETKE